MSLNQLLYAGTSNSVTNYREWLNIIVNSIRFGSSSDNGLDKYIVSDPIAGTFNDGSGTVAATFYLTRIGNMVTGKLTCGVISTTGTVSSIGFSEPIPADFIPTADTNFIVPSVRAAASSGALDGYAYLTLQFLNSSSIAFSGSEGNTGGNGVLQGNYTLGTVSFSYII